MSQAAKCRPKLAGKSGLWITAVAVVGCYFMHKPIWNKGMNHSRSLVTFAFVQEALERGDIVAGLFPLFAPAIKRRRGTTFDPEVFAKDLNELCGLSVPGFVIEDWAPRMAKEGLLITRDRQAAGDTSFVSYTCADPDVPDVQDMESRIVDLFDAFEAYSKPLFQEHALKAPPRSDLERELVKRIQSMEFGDISAKPDRAVEAPAIPVLKKRRPGNINHPAQLMDVVCATFFLYFKQKQPARFALIT